MWQCMIWENFTHCDYLWGRRGQYTGTHIGYKPESKVHGANVGPIWGRQDRGGPHVGSMNFANWETWKYFVFKWWKLSLWIELNYCWHLEINDYHQRPIRRMLEINQLTLAGHGLFHANYVNAFAVGAWEPGPQFTKPSRAMISHVTVLLCVVSRDKGSP